MLHVEFKKYPCRRVEFKKRQCHRVNFRGLDPYKVRFGGVGLYPGLSLKVLFMYYIPLNTLPYLMI